MKNKEFDSVAMMREIRDTLQLKYESSPQQLDNDLARIRDKYKHLLKKDFQFRVGAK